MVMVLLMMILIMGIFGWIMYAYFESMYSSKLLKINSDVTCQLADNITTQIDSLREAQESFSVNTTVNRFLSTDSEYEKLTLMPLYESLQQAYKKMCPGLHSIVLKKKDGSIFSDPSGISEINISNTAPAFAKLETGAQTVLIINDSKAFVAMKQDVYQSGSIRKKVGSCMFVILADSLMSSLKSQDAASRELFVLNCEGRVVAHNGNADVGAELAQPYAAYLEGQDGIRQQLTDSENIVAMESILPLGWTVMCLTPKSTVLGELSVIKHTFYLLLVCMLLVVSIVYLMQELSINRAFRRFIAHINAIASGQQVQPLKLRDSAEFHQMAEAFNRMMRKLETLNAHNLEYHEKLLLQDIENKQSQLLALQSQINPHFLYNTLECINSAGAMCGSREVEEISTALAFIFRYAIKGENIVRLQDELNTLQYYLNIQQIRFFDRFCVHYDIPDELREHKMLKFLLQPIVENSIQHGFQACTPPCVIRIAVSECNGKLRVVIADNGTGIKPDRLEALQTSLDNYELSTDSIGLMNIQRRIRLYYGEAFGLHVESEYGKGTTITVLLPTVDSTAHEEQQHV